jgi:hypothetical protein
MAAVCLATGTGKGKSAGRREKEMIRRIACAAAQATERVHDVELAKLHDFEHAQK